MNSAVRAVMCAGSRMPLGTAKAVTNPFQFMQQVRAEVSKIVWPTRREVMLTTVMVFIMAALTAVFFAMVDLGIRGGLRAVLTGLGG